MIEISTHTHTHTHIECLFYLSFLMMIDGIRRRHPWQKARKDLFIDHVFQAMKRSIDRSEVFWSIRFRFESSKDDDDDDDEEKKCGKRRPLQRDFWHQAKRKTRKKKEWEDFLRRHLINSIRTSFTLGRVERSNQFYLRCFLPCDQIGFLSYHRM